MFSLRKKRHALLSAAQRRRPPSFVHTLLSLLLHCKTCTAIKEHQSKPQVFALPYNARHWLPSGLPPTPPHSSSLGNTTVFIRTPHSGPPLRSTSSASQDERMALREARRKRIHEFAERYRAQSSKVIDGNCVGQQDTYAISSKCFRKVGGRKVSTFTCDYEKRCAEVARSNIKEPPGSHAA